MANNKQTESPKVSLKLKTKKDVFFELLQDYKETQIAYLSELPHEISPDDVRDLVDVVQTYILDYQEAV